MRKMAIIKNNYKNDEKNETMVSQNVTNKGIGQLSLIVPPRTHLVQTTASWASIAGSMDSFGSGDLAAYKGSAGGKSLILVRIRNFGKKV